MRRRTVLIIILGCIAALAIGGVVFYRSQSTNRMINAMMRDGIAAVEYEIDLGADVNHTWQEMFPGLGGLPDSNSTFTPLYLAAINNLADICELLIEHGAEVNRVMPDTSGATALWVATVLGHYAVVEVLLDHGADATAPAAGGAPLALLAARKSKALVILLQDAGADVLARDLSGGSALHWATYSSDPSLIAYLVEQRVPVDARNDRNFTPMMNAAWNEKAIEMIEAFIEHGPDVNAVNSDGETTLMQAVQGGTPVPSNCCLRTVPTRMLATIWGARR